MFNETTWKDGEQRVQNYLKKNGYKILYTNFSCVGVELDIVSILSVKNQKRKLKLELKEKLREVFFKQEKENIKNYYKNITKELSSILIVTEVKSRTSDRFGKGLDSITESKKRHIKRGTEFLLKDVRFRDYQVRFDVASVDDGVITYIENAF